jgi:1-phosphofructokinase family hexose kinase
MTLWAAGPSVKASAPATSSPERTIGQDRGWKDGGVLPTARAGTPRARAGTLLVISLAPALDRYARAAIFQRGTINRPRSVTALAGGKGLNAARTANRLGVRTRSVALVGGVTGEAVRRRAAAEGLMVTWVDSGVETRQCLSLLDESDGSMTEVYEAVLPVPAEIWPAVLVAVRTQLEDLTRADVVAISGRVPDGLPDDAVAQLVGLATAAGIPVLVDSDGEQLARAARRGPALVKVNAAEAAAATGTDPEHPWAAAKALQALGAGTVVITLGPGGALCLAEDGRRLEVRHDPLEHALPVGSGDAFLAGLAVRRLRPHAVPDPVPARLADPTADAVPDGLPEALRYAAAAGRANARHLEAGSCTPATVQAELPAIVVRTL